MRRAIILTLAIAILTGCKTAKPPVQQIPTVPIETITDTRIIHTESIDTLYIQIPAQSAERTAPEKFSHLETDYAESDAKINQDGTLSHSIRNKPAKHPVPVKNSTDTIITERLVEKPIPVEVPRYTERQLTWWEKTRLDTWIWIAAALALSLGWICRRPLAAFARRLLKK